MPPSGGERGETDAPGERIVPRNERHAAAESIAPAVARQIDENLRLLYRRRAEEDLPPELQALVAQLRESSGANPDEDENHPPRVEE